MTEPVALRIVQSLLGAYFVAVGVLHFIVPEGLPEPMSWMYELSDSLHLVAGIVEILGGLGLLTGAFSRSMRWLTPVAAGGLILVMLGAAIWHFGRNEFAQIGGNLFTAALLALVGYRGRSVIGGRGLTGKPAG